MSARPLSLRPAVMVLATLFVVARVHAQLAATSPFLPAQNAAAVGAPTPGAPLEYRATMETGEGVLFRIVDPAKKSGSWVKLNERDKELDFVVKQHDGSGDNETVVVEQSGRTFTLPLRSAKVVSSGSAGNLAPPPPPPNMPNVPAAVTNAVVVNPTPADEQRRLEAVAAEVARRRALREQATQQNNLGPPVAPQMVQDPRVQQQQQQMQQQANQRPGNPPQQGRAQPPAGRRQ